MKKLLTADTNSMTLEELELLRSNLIGVQNKIFTKINIINNKITKLKKNS